MELRPYFLFGDVVANTACGALTGMAVSSLLGASWPPVLGMLAGMIAGMLLASVLALVWMPLLGAFEVMLPVMLSGMLAGMAVSLGEVTVRAAAIRGALAGVVSLAFVYALSSWARRRRSSGH